MDSEEDRGLVWWTNRDKRFGQTRKDALALKHIITETLPV